MRLPKGVLGKELCNEKREIFHAAVRLCHRRASADFRDGEAHPHSGKRRFLQRNPEADQRPEGGERRNQGKIADVQVQYQENEDEIADIISRKNVIDQELQLLYDQVENISQFSQWQENSDFFRSCRILPPENEQKKNA